ncbi:hypothetical protein PV325_005162 [Microctonus aethiopoides]|nr:hypothetical protein PV325_005162 [Microctonus aethiopoides]
MSIDRYFAIRSPIALRRDFNRKSTIMIIAALWVVSLSIFAPVLRAATVQSPDLQNITLAMQQLDEDNKDDGVDVNKPPVIQFCLEDFKPLGIDSHVFGIFCFVLIYAIPGFIVVLTYSLMGRTLCARKPPFDSDNNEGSASSQQGFRLVRERKRIAWILLTLAVLFAMCWLPYNVLQLLIDLGIIYEGSVIPAVRSYCLYLGHANSALNPIVYCFMTRNFRRSVAGLICGNRRHYNRSNSVHNNKAGVGGICVGSSLKQRGGWDPRRPRAFAIAAVARPLGRSMALERSATSSSGYDSSHSRHSPHRRCYMLKSMPGRVDKPTVAFCTLNKINFKQESHFATSLNDFDDKSRHIMDPRRSQSFHAFSDVAPRYHQQQHMYEESTNHTTQLTHLANDV